MAIDEAIADAVSQGNVAPTLRFYGWSRPTLSLGYFQPIAGAAAWSNDTVDVVRRSTGGGAILHHRELTYSLTLPLSDTSPGARESVYRGVHRCFQDVLATLGISTAPYREIAGTEGNRPPPPAAIGKRRVSKSPDPFLCFQRRTEEDLICHGYKILGSAQRRVRGGVLQHGSLLLQSSSFADCLPGINELTGQNLTAEKLTEALASCLGETLAIDWQTAGLTEEEQRSSQRICNTRYAADRWTQRR